MSCILAALMTMAAPYARASAAAVESAVSAAESWLAVVDGGDYSKSWEDSAALFRAAVTKEQWAQALAASRKPLGSLESRKVKSTQYATSLPGAPDGEYVVIQFATSFANKKSAIETVTPMKDSDGAWRVSGYYIK
jgi:hypothetical protein